METIKKISHSHFLGAGMNAAKVAKLGGESGKLHVIRIAGIVLDTATVPTQYGESVALIGSFVATDPRTGEQVKAAKCFLPDVAILPLAAAVKNGGNPQFAVDLFATLDEKSSVGFSYSLEELIESDADPVAALMAKASGIKPLALAAPGGQGHGAEGKETPTPTAPAKSTKGKGK